MTITERFFKYIKIDTTPNAESKESPTSICQIDFAKILVEDLKELGVEEIILDENGYITGKIKGNAAENTPVIAFIAHMDTAPNYSGKDVNPRIIENYQGDTVVLNQELSLEMEPKDFPELAIFKNQDLIVTDGKTLLGADDKAGIVEIMEMLKKLKENPSIKHGEIRVAFTPDEEIGRGAELLNLERLAADFGYTIDGGELGGIEYENFNAASCTIEVTGRDIHTGMAKDKMINAISIANEIDRMLPANERPEFTEGYEGFYHMHSLLGSVEKATMKYLIRDHSKEGFLKRKELFKNIESFIKNKYKNIELKIAIEDSYFNMRDKVEPYMEIIELTKKVMKECGIEPKVTPIRGGTDGARLSYRGLPCPNIFTGGLYPHGKYECISVQALEKTADFLVSLIEKIATSEIKIKK